MRIALHPQSDVNISILLRLRYAHLQSRLTVIQR